MMPSAIAAQVRWIREFDNDRHEQESERCEACAEAQHQQDRKHDLAAA